MQTANVYTACSPVWTLAKKGSQIAEPAAFNGMLTDASGKAPFVMHALDTVDVHIWAPGSSSPYQEQVADETSGQTSSVLVLISPKRPRRGRARGRRLAAIGVLVQASPRNDAPPRGRQDRLLSPSPYRRTLMIGDHSGQLVPGDRRCSIGITSASTSSGKHGWQWDCGHRPREEGAWR